ncbi:alpha/beta-hydrolase [Cadophora sp. DSE1049]|nr:alpha/beta-hydrolase [Cadophora sp. DSE1049]
MSSTTSSIPEHALLNLAAHLPTFTPRTPTLSLSPLIISTPNGNRPQKYPINIRITAPTVGSSLPVLLLSHGQGSSNNLSSLNGYAPLVDYYASHGFVVIQPTHLSSKTLSLGAKLKLGEPPLFWKSRILDFHDILDAQSDIEAGFPAIAGRLDWSRVGIIGHSMGAHTASFLLGAQYKSPHTTITLHDPRIRAGVLIGAPGHDGPDGATQTPMAKSVAPFFAHTDFNTMTTPALTVFGDEDVPDYLTTRGVEWHRDPFVLGGGDKKDLLTVKEAGHIFGGVSGWDVRETGEDESVERVGVVCRMAGAWLRRELGMGDGDKSWEEACEVLKGLEGLGSVEGK